MNKKFSTLVASLLFASAFSAYAGTTAPMVTGTTTSISTRALEADGSIVVTPGNGPIPTPATGLLNGFTNNSRLRVWKLDGNQEGIDPVTNPINTTGATTVYPSNAPFDAFYFNYVNGQLIGADGNVLSFSIGGHVYQKFDIVPVKDGGNDDAATVYFLLKAQGVADGYLTLANDGQTWSLETETNAKAGKASLFASMSAAATEAATGTDLNAKLNKGFNMSIAFPGVADASIKGAELFAGKLTAVLPGDGETLATAGTSYYLRNEDGDFIVYDESIQNGNVAGGFKLLDKGATGNSNPKATFAIKVADNNPEAIEVTVNSGMQLYINRTVGLTVAYSLTAIAPASLNGQPANWALTSFGSTNSVDFKTFLTGKFVKVSFVKKSDQTSDPNDVAYKTNGILSLKYDATATPTPIVKSDYVKTSSVVAEDPATMWAPSIVANELVLTNRENKEIVVKIGALRDLKNGVYQIESLGATADGLIAGEQIKIEFVNSVTKTDGYMVEAENVLKNTVYYLGQSRRNADGDVPAYWAENHGTHQIGATVNQEEATQWRVELIKKDVAGYKTQIDSVLVVSPLSSYDAATGITTVTPDTLAVLPYVFQNSDNLEYVKLNPEAQQHYYICDKDNKDNPRAARIFALKKKPGNTYNYFTLATPVAYTEGNSNPVNSISDKTTASGNGSKVYLKNSASLGAWENVAAYADDANSLMVVDPIDRPEYRKVKAAWGDTVKIYREEYPTEVLFEKRDPKAVVDGQVLSFLNVNNSVTGANPALFVDTAYVNRVDADGIANTCYQYLLAVDVDKENSYYCPYNPEHNTDEWRHEHGGPCADAKENVALKGRFLINLVDTAFAYKQDHLHNNPYINMYEADEDLAKLAFVEGIHVKDTLILTRKGGEPVRLEMDKPKFNVAKFAFRYVNNEDGTFKIQTQWKDYKNSTTKKELDDSANDNGYLRWVNGTVVVTNKYTNGETFNMEENYKGNPVANEDITTSSVKVTTAEGKVIIAGAQGKKVAISNVLGQTIANAVLSSDNATIATPSGVVIVAVEGEAAVKAIVK